MTNHKKLTANLFDFKSAVQLSSSKSESNRALMIRAYGNFDRHIKKLSDADDTILLRDNLELIDDCAKSSIPLIIDCANAGTTFRFLVTHMASKPGTWMLTGSDRMKERPVGELVEALRKLGAEIDYIGEQGFPPLRIQGKNITGGKLSLSTSKSSQFASSLLLAAPTWPQGLELELIGDQSSTPYLDLTIAIMQHYKADVSQAGNRIVVKPKPYQNIAFTTQPDWSSASYWYEMVALSKGGELLLQQLDMQSIQGDKVVADIFEKLGVHSHQEPNGVRIFKKENFVPEPLSFDFRHSPDLLPTVAATCSGLGVEAHFSGLKNLKYKESDRILAMKNELNKIGVRMEALSEDEYKLIPAKKLPDFTKDTAVVFDTWADHRLAMSLSPLALKVGAVQINNPDVVSKSYPNFWNVLRKTGILK